LKKDNIEIGKTELYRPLFLYHIIENITSSNYNKIKIFTIVGPSRSGKSLFMELA
jgi:ABC-type phosphate transport system ATPase subunit